MIDPVVVVRLVDRIAWRILLQEMGTAGDPRLKRRDDDDSAAPLSVRRKLLYGSLVTLLFVGVAEGVLALLGVQPAISRHDPLVGFESTIPLFQRYSAEGVDYWQTSENKLAFFNPQKFLARKPDGVCRVFCLGGSTTFGRPYDDRTSFAGWLREFLPAADRSRRWEVINAGGISYASYRVTAVMEELVRHSPDLFIIYTGHNEFLEDRAYAKVRGFASAAGRLASPLLKSRTYAIASRAVGAAPHEPADRVMMPGEVDAILDRSVGPEAYTRDVQHREQVLAHFRINLQRMIRLARSSGAKVILVTPASNLKDFSPFKSEHRLGLADEMRRTWADHVAAAQVHQQNGAFDKAYASLGEAARIDDQRADLHFQWGQVALAMGRHAEARESFERSIDLDVCPLRAPTEIRRTVEQIAVENRVPLIDFAGVIANASLEQFGHDSPGREFFLDHVHPTIESNRLLALAIMQAMTRAGSLRVGPQWGRQEIAEASRRVESRIDVELQSRGLTNLAQVLSWAGKQTEAGPLAVAAVRLREQAGLEDDSEGLFYAAVAMATDGQDQEAMSLLERVVTRQPRHAEARWRMGALLYDGEMYEDALIHFREAAVLSPRDPFLHRMLGLTLIKLRRYEDALSALREANRLAPDDPVVLRSIELAERTMGGG